MRKFERDAEGRIVCDDDPGDWLDKAVRRPPDFAYFGDNPDMFDTWATGPCIEHRDSDACDRSNAAALIKLLKSDPSLDDDWDCDKASHWAVGWVKHLTFRAF